MRPPVQILVYPVKAGPNGWEYFLLHRLATRGDSWQGVTGGVEEIVEYVFLAQVNGRQAPILDAREHDEWKWCRFEDALESLIWPGNREALKQCDIFLRGPSSGISGGFTHF